VAANCGVTLYHAATMCGQQADQQYPPWDDSSFKVKNDLKWVAQYRRLQSWYRENILGAPPGWFQGAIRGNHLDAEWLAANPDANFLNDEIAAYVRTRVPIVKGLGGVIEEKRLYSNLMSSQPVCFNLFGYLRGHMDEAAAPLAQAFDLDIAQITNIEVEVPSSLLGDGTAFDAYIEYLTSSGERAFIGVETKYTEKFSNVEYDVTERYREVTESPGSGFRAGAADVLNGKLTNQLWRNAMLAVAHREANDFGVGHVAVVYSDGDSGLDKAITAFRDQLDDEESLLRAATYQRLMEYLEPITEFQGWVASFRRRYLNLVAG
jgi:hypothetical protein